MTTDIHDLDKYIGKYVSITDEDGEGGSGYVVEVRDRVEYQKEPSRILVWDWGGGWPVSASATVEEVGAPAGEVPPAYVENPITILHLALDGGPCPSPETCPSERQAADGLRSFRAWQQRQDDAYWQRVWVDRARAFMDDPHSISEITRDARDEGAPPHIISAMEALVEQTLGSDGGSDA
jgi:hypothetical protein